MDADNQSHVPFRLKRTYTSPELICRGSVAKLTEQNGTELRLDVPTWSGVRGDDLSQVIGSS